MLAMGIERFHNHPNIQDEGLMRERERERRKGNEPVWMN